MLEEATKEQEEAVAKQRADEEAASKAAAEEATARMKAAEEDLQRNAREEAAAEKRLAAESALQAKAQEGKKASAVPAVGPKDAVTGATLQTPKTNEPPLPQTVRG